jgi:hypothetical protein
MPRQRRHDRSAPLDARRDRRRGKCHRRRPRRRCIRCPPCREHLRFLFCCVVPLAQSPRDTREKLLNLAQELAIQRHGITSPPLRCLSFSALLSGVERVSFFFFFLDFHCPPTLRLEKKSNESALNISSLSFRSFSRTRPFLALSSAPSSDTGLISPRPPAGKGKEKPAAQGDTTGVFCRRLARFRSVVAGVLSGPSSSPLSLSHTHTHLNDASRSCSSPRKAMADGRCLRRCGWHGRGLLRVSVVSGVNVLPCPLV